MDKLHIQIDFANIQQGICGFILSGQMATPLGFQWDVLGQVPDIELLNLTGIDPVDHQFMLPLGEFVIRYQLKTALREYVGSQRDIYFNYPFANENEAFISAGALPVPVQEFEGALSVEFVNLPPNWQVFSNLEPMHSAKLESFFAYASQPVPIWEAEHQFQHSNIMKMRLQVQYGKTIPFTAETFFPFVHKWLDFLETHLAPYTKTDHLDILILQAPANFKELVSAPTFATGENMMNGIVCYAPLDGDYLENLFGYRDYGYFLLEGVVHELAHLYASSGDASSKSILYAAPDCPRHDRMLIGESLPGYIHRLYMFTHYHGDTQKFFTDEVSHWLKQYKARPRLNLLMKWLVLDIYLQTVHQSSVLKVFGEMVRMQQSAKMPFTSQQIVFEALQRLGIELDSHHQNLFNVDFAGDIVDLLKDALLSVGLALYEHDEQIQMVGIVTTFKLD